MHLILLLAVGGVVGIATASGLNAAGLRQADLTPKVAGFNANWLMGGLGLAGLFLGGPLVAAAGAGALAGSLINALGTPRIEAGLQNVLALQAGGAAPQLPGLAPAAPTTPVPPIQLPQRGPLSWFNFGRRQ